MTCCDRRPSLALVAATMLRSKTLPILRLLPLIQLRLEIEVFSFEFIIIICRFISCFLLLGKRRREETSTPTKAATAIVKGAAATFEGDGRANSVTAYRAMCDAWRTSEANVLKQVNKRQHICVCISKSRTRFTCLIEWSHCWRCAL